LIGASRSARRIGERGVTQQRALQAASSVTAIWACAVVAPRISSPTTAGFDILAAAHEIPDDASKTGVVAPRDRTLQPWRDIAVEAHFALVEPQRSVPV